LSTVRLLLVMVVMLVLLVVAPAAGAFAPNDPLFLRQWYLGFDHAFDAWADPPALLAVKVAVIDSGIDGSHPEFAGKIVAARSFVGGSALVDTNGHGTFVAGEIAASVNDGDGIAGVAPAALLVIAKVVARDGSISAAPEAAAIRWAVNQGAQVINLSLGGLRDPGEPVLDLYSPLEASAVRYALTRHVVVVAAVGNGTSAPRQPWPYADWPAALPHVIGVSALTEAGDVPDFSNRDTRFNQIAAPGANIYSTVPLALTAARPGCADQGYSDCGPAEFQDAIGTSFAAPQVAAAAADLLGIDPTLLPDQVAWLLERSADDVNPATGCSRCGPGRDPLSGWGKLNVAAAIQALRAAKQPIADPFDPNDDAGSQAYPLWGNDRTVSATVDFWQNPRDVFRTYLHQRHTLTATLQTQPHTRLLLWRPGTSTVTGATAKPARNLASETPANGQTKTLRFTSSTPGWYYLEVQQTAAGAATYTLTITKH
jgi:serine protease